MNWRNCAGNSRLVISYLLSQENTVTGPIRTKIWKCGCLALSKQRKKQHWFNKPKTRLEAYPADLARAGRKFFPGSHFPHPCSATSVTLPWRYSTLYLDPGNHSFIPVLSFKSVKINQGGVGILLSADRFCCQCMPWRNLNRFHDLHAAASPCGGCDWTYPLFLSPGAQGTERR